MARGCCDGRRSRRSRHTCADAGARSRATALLYAITTRCLTASTSCVLGPSLVYSCAYFATGEDTLELAQEQKLDLICRKLRLRPGERLLDIGCGWGSLLIHAAGHYGAECVGVTLSESQAQLAMRGSPTPDLEQRAERARRGLSRAQRRPLDKVASVGMYEHVGRAELPPTRARCARCCALAACSSTTGSRACIPPRRRRTFISRYVFPDGELHPLADLMSALHGVWLRAARRRGAARALRAYAPPLARNLAAPPRRGLARGRRRARARLASLHARLRERVRNGEITVYQVLAARDGAPHGLPLRRSWIAAGASRRPQEPGRGGRADGGRARAPLIARASLVDRDPLMHAP